MPRKRRDEEQNRVPELKGTTYYAPSDAYHQDALNALSSGAYGKQHMAQRRAAEYQKNLADEQKKYSYNKEAAKNNTLEKADKSFGLKSFGLESSDHDYLQRIYDRYGDSELTRRSLRESNQTKDWERKYGKSYDQIYEDFLADQGNVKMQMGEEHPFLTEIGSVLNSIPTAVTALPSLYMNIVDPENPMAKNFEKIRSKKSEENKYWRAGVKENTGEKGDKAVDMINSLADRMAVTTAGKVAGTALGGTGLGDFLGSTMAGLSEANQRMDDLNLRPELSARQKALTALGHGAVEAGGTALVGGWLDKIPGAKNLGGSLWNLGKGAFEGAAENAGAEVLHNTFDTVINKENSQKELNKAIFMAQGMSEEEAEDMARNEQAKNVGMAALTGAGFGAGMRGVSVGAKKLIPSLFDPEYGKVETYKIYEPDENAKAPVSGEAPRTNIEQPKVEQPTETEIRAELDGANRVGIGQNPDKPIILPGTQGVIELEDTKPIEVDPNNVIYHSGTLSRLNKSETRGKMHEGSRNTGYFGTGHYFVDNAHRGEIDNNSNYNVKPYTSVDISKYGNLYKADTDAKAEKLHGFSEDYTRYVNTHNDSKYYTDADGHIDEEARAEYLDDLYKTFRELFPEQPTTKEQFINQINAFRESEYDVGLLDRDDSVFTQLMKSMGYNGVDTTGTRFADTRYGTVIYDLDEDSILQSNVTDDEVKKGLMNTRVRNKGQSVFDTAEDEKIQKSLDAVSKRRAIGEEYRKLFDEPAFRQLKDELKETKDYLDRSRESLEEDTYTLNNPDAFAEKVEKHKRLLKEYNLASETDEEAIQNVRYILENDIEDTKELIAQREQRVKELQASVDEMEKASKAAYAQAKANVEGISEDAVESTPKVSAPEPDVVPEVKPVETPVVTEPVNEVPELNPNQGTYEILQNTRVPEMKPEGGDQISQHYYTLKNSDMFQSSEAKMKMLEEAKEAGKFNKGVEGRLQAREEALRAYVKDPELAKQENMSKQWDSGKDIDTSMLIMHDALENGNQTDFNLTALKQTEELKGAARELRATRDYSGTKEGTLTKGVEFLNDKADAVLKSKKTKTQLESITDKIFNDGDYSRLADLGLDETNIQNIRNAVEAGASKENVVKMLAVHKAVGATGISADTLSKINDIYNEIEARGLNPTSRARAELEADAFKVLAQDIGGKRTVKEMWDAWRYLAMLGNPKTHLRNILGNTTHYMVTEAKDSIGAVMEEAIDKANRAMGGEGIERTKSILTGDDNDLVAKTAQDADDVAYAMLNDMGNKYNVKNEIDRARDAFNSKIVSKIDELNSNLLDTEDYSALKRKYSKSLARFLKANGADESIFDATDDASKALLDKGRAYAIDQAKQATFHEYSKLADSLTQLSKNLQEGGIGSKAAGAAIEGLVPFKKTPINILKQAGKYSPISLAKGIGKMLDSVKTGNSTASDAIEDFASGLTGTGIMALGYFLAHEGFLTGGQNEDYDVDNAETEQGKQNYALKIGNKSYTLDWLAPLSLPLFVGAEMSRLFDNDTDEDVDTVDKVLSALSTIAEPVTEMSMLQGIQNALNE